MRVLVLGASGATGKLVVKQFMQRNIHCRILVRESAILEEEIKESPFVETMKGNISELTDLQMESLVSECNVIISCLGHNPSCKGMFGNPRYLVFHAVKRITEIIENQPSHKVKLILMSTAGYTDEATETNTKSEKIILSLLKMLIPPHKDNVKAADFLVKEAGRRNENIEWVIVRPDTLVDHNEESLYEVYASPIRSPLFNAGKTSRINVSHFMKELATIDEVWEKWKFKSPVIYNKE
ncbi:NAD(P)-dependent oxidoreductase [Alkalicoccus daliensis]|uniref:Putative NADH-flavin reductase n=1 Tax=Alkalicoccus daliensis TaxID=745820 RepID=A0A1H0D6S4_9BACI|nr:NAD(P)H-binding protein [Alkalicoccus daliensis]SDN65884.1 Putative NADH-flavin reductase [Alkalicoccus daliensis]